MIFDDTTTTYYNPALQDQLIDPQSRNIQRISQQTIQGMPSNPKSTSRRICVLIKGILVVTSIVSSHSSTTRSLQSSTFRTVEIGTSHDNNDSPIIYRSLTSVCPTNPNIIGYTNWKDLSNDISSDEFDSDAVRLYTICPDTTMTPEDDEAITITKNSEIKCGDSDVFGSTTCVVSGGSTHFVISGDDTNVFFRSITFQGASSTSIRAQASGGSSSANFLNCQWLENEGDNGGAAMKVSKSDENQIRAMNVNFDRCSFIENSSNDGAISLADNAIATFSFSIFHGNVLGGAILSYDSEISFSHCCFTSNVNNNGQGIVVIGGSTGAYFSSLNNYGKDNIVPLDDSCSDGVFVEVGDDSNGYCKDFEEYICRNGSESAPSISPILNTPSPVRNTSRPSPQSSTFNDVPSKYILIMSGVQFLYFMLS